MSSIVPSFKYVCVQSWAAQHGPIAQWLACQPHTLTVATSILAVCQIAFVHSCALGGALNTRLSAGGFGRIKVVKCTGKWRAVSLPSYN